MLLFKVQTLATRYKEDMDRIFPTPNITADEYKRGLKHIHSNSVTASNSTVNINKVLNDFAPEISSEEKQLDRYARTRLAQLRSGYSTLLNTYMKRINRSDTDECPSCSMPQTTDHLFTCPMNPTDLSTLDLWHQPIKCAEFLGITNEEDEEGIG